MLLVLLVLLGRRKIAVPLRQRLWRILRIRRAVVLVMRVRMGMVQGRVRLVLLVRLLVRLGKRWRRRFAAAAAHAADAAQRSAATDAAPMSLVDP